MLDFVTDSKGSYKSNKRRVSDEFRHLLPEKGMPKLFKNALSLADTIHQHTNSTKFTFLSPKFGSIVKQDKHDSKYVYSVFLGKLFVQIYLLFFAKFLIFFNFHTINNKHFLVAFYPQIFFHFTKTILPYFRFQKY